MTETAHSSPRLAGSHNLTPAGVLAFGRGEEPPFQFKHNHTIHMTDTHIKDGGPAFPASPTYGPNGDLYRPADIGCEGMTLRDWFAGQASESDVMHWRNAVGVGCTREMAKYAYADAMLAAQKGGVK